MTLGRAELCRLIPHAGAMCLLDAVVSWDQTSVVCTSRTHRDPANPLSRDGRLPAVCAVEYAAQATAVHGALLRAVSAAGFLASVRDVRLRVPRLDAAGEELRVQANVLGGGEGGVSYGFVVSAGDAELASGRLSVFLPRTGGGE